MLGTRGVRLGVLHPEIYEMQVRAIFRAALAIAEPPQLEIMIPLVAYEQELELMRELVERVAEEEGAGDLDFSVGTMIELPRACFVADRIAEHADFFSFGTNDLTQTALGFSRDDVEGSFLNRYIERKILDRSPFETIDKPGVGWLVRLAAWVGREAKPGPQARHLRRARRRPGLDRVLPDGRARLRELLALPRADRARRRRAIGRDSPASVSLRAHRAGRLMTNAAHAVPIISRADRAARGGALSPLATRSYPGRARASPSRTRTIARRSSATATGSCTPRRSGA